MNYNELKSLYSDNFSLGYLDTNIKDKFALISLVCELTKLAQRKNPDANCYRILKKITENENIPHKFIVGLSIVCEDFYYGCSEFITFGLQPKEYVSTIKQILNSYIPF